MPEKKFFKCQVCADIHFGKAGPEICPTCSQRDVYELIDSKDAKKSLVF